MNHDADAKYLIGVSRGEQGAFQFLYVKYRAPLIRHLLYFLHSEVVASDLVQDVFLKIWVFRERLPEVQYFNAFIYKAARNAALDYLKNSAVQQHYVSNYLSVSGVSQIEEKYIALETAQVVDALILKMPPQRMRVFILSRREGMKNKEIAQILQISHKTVANHLHIALNEIRKKINY